VLTNLDLGNIPWKKAPGDPGARTISK